MSNILWVNVFHPFEDLLHEFPYLGHRNVFLILFTLLDYFLQIGAAELKNEILSCLPLVVLRVINVEELNDIRAIAQFVQNLKLSTDIFSCLGRPFDRHRFFMLFVICFEDIAYWERLTYYSYLTEAAWADYSYRL